MRNQTFFILVFSAIFAQFPGCHTLSNREEWEEDQRKRIDDDLKFVQTGKEKDAVINWLVAERWDHKKTNDEKIAAEKDKMTALTNYHGLKIPLDVRNYVILIEERFGDTVNSVVPKRIHMLAIQTKNYDDHIRNRMYKWWNIFDQKEDDMYVELVLEELKKDFKCRYPNSKIGDDTYNKYILSVGEAIARDCIRVNDLIAHIQAGASIKLEKLGFFDAAVDRKVTLFYNALVPTQV